MQIPPEVKAAATPPAPATPSTTDKVKAFVAKYIWYAVVLMVIGVGALLAKFL